MYQVDVWMNDYTAFVFSEDDLSEGDEIVIETRDYVDVGWRGVKNNILSYFDGRDFHREQDTTKGIVIDCYQNRYVVEAVEYPSE